MANHPHRLAPAHYRGFYHHFLTASTYGRRPAFTDPMLCAAATAQLFQSGTKHGFAILAYCLMPDHIHVLVEAERADADFLRSAHLWRQLSGFWERKRTGRSLWQEGYWDYTLRDDESVLAIASYVVWNPVRAGLCQSPEDDPFTGSARLSVPELAAHPPHRPRRGRSDGQSRRSPNVLARTAPACLALS